MTSTMTGPGLSLIFEQYATRLRRTGSPHTIKNWGIIAGRFDRWLRERGLTPDTVSQLDVEDYFDGLALSDSSKGTHFRMLRSAYNYAGNGGRLAGRNPMLDVKLRDPDPKAPRTIPTSELRVIRAGIVLERDWLWFHLLAYTGMRRAEVAGLRWWDGADEGTSVVKLDQQTIRVLGKGRKLRVVPIHPELGECLRAAGGAPGAFVVPSVGDNGISLDTIQRISRRLHPVYTPHDFRRTVATNLRRNGIDESVRNRIMGWGAKDIFQRYYDDVADAELHRGILRLYADDPIVV